MGGFLSLEIRSVRVCHTAERVPNTLLFKEPPRNAAINVIFGNLAQANALWTAELPSMFLLSSVPS